ncbi:N-acetyltransferase [Kribbella sandramycini]|uniref:N-acetyltransferase n=1 Tax=Kribbella sandramycini TaxID=60450 RepID=A0A7Y4L722_9ACTN|nr:N-acetyltransferase [Kribbella sandramycini]MBB6566785.1 hypothetical protein [Kribbella sandramycini]NOL45569.1 N-acetyltransferase [Kribbella sandramycini]
MGQLERETVAAAGDAWVLSADEMAVVETAEYRLVRFPQPAADPLQLSWVRTTRPAAEVLTEAVVRAREFKLPELFVYAKISAPDGLADALLSRGAVLVDACDLLAMPLPADVKSPELPGLDIRWRTTLDVARDANAIGAEVFGGPIADDELLLPRVEADRAAQDRLTWAQDRAATMTLTYGRTTTSSPILQRLGFTTYGQERMYKLPL